MSIVNEFTCPDCGANMASTFKTKLQLFLEHGSECQQ